MQTKDMIAFVINDQHILLPSYMILWSLKLINGFKDIWRVYHPLFNMCLNV